jgi:hypothetical protein
LSLGCEPLIIASIRFTGCDKGMYAGARGFRGEVELLVSSIPDNHVILSQLSGLFEPLLLPILSTYYVTMMIFFKSASREGQI